MTLRLGVLVSGRGTNLQAILDAVERHDLDARVVLVISNRAGVPALDRAQRHGVPTAVFTRAAFSSRAEQQAAIQQALQAANVDLVVLAGFDQVLLPEFIAAFPGRIINVHPSLLPAFAGGLHAQRDALVHGVKITGCTVHFVTEAVDAGPIIVQAAVPVLDDDTEETLAARILPEEHRCLVEAIRLIASGAITIEGRRVVRRRLTPAAGAQDAPRPDDTREAEASVPSIAPSAEQISA